MTVTKEKIESVLVTGATGFIGRNLVNRLCGQKDKRVFVLVRDIRQVEALWPGVEVGKIEGDLTDIAVLSKVEERFDTIFHLAGDAHAVGAEREADVHSSVTVVGSMRLFDVAMNKGLKRFIFFSSVKAMGEGTAKLTDESCAPEPKSAYGKARLKAEEFLLSAGKRYGVHVCNLRLAMVYGAGCKGNIPRMIAAIDKNLFPTIPEVNNKRSMVHVQDVINAAFLAMDLPAAAGKTYIVTDGEAYSTRELYLALCRGLGKQPRSWVVPVWLLRAAARIGDRVKGRVSFPLDSDTLDKLLGSAWYRSERITRELGYKPTRTFYDAVSEMIVDYRSRCA